MKLQISKIVIDETIYPRHRVDEFNITRLSMAHKSGAQIPPLIVEAKTHRLVDGRHRYEMYKREGVETVEVEKKVYASDADFFADAVRYNVGHGETLDQYDVRNAIIRLAEYGYERERISEVVRLPAEQIEKIERGFASSQSTGGPVALKGGLSHLRGQTLTPQQININRKYGGGKATFYANQIADLLENDMWPRTETFIGSMTRLVALWEAINSKETEAA